MHHAFEPSHTNTGLQIFAVLIAKEGLAGTSPAKPSFGMTLTIKFCPVVSQITFYSQYHNKRRFGASQALFWYYNNKDLRPGLACQGSFITRRPDAVLRFIPYSLPINSIFTIFITLYTINECILSQECSKK